MGKRKRLRNVIEGRLPKPQHKGFFSLPSELRDRIYRYVLCIEDSGIVIGREGTMRIEDNTLVRLSARVHLSCLLVSRQIHTEAFHIFYRYNTFHFRSTYELCLFLQNIGYPRRQQVTTVVVKWRGQEPLQLFCLLKECDLKSLTIRELNQSERLAELRDVRGLERISITSDSEPDYDCQELERAMMRPRLSTDRYENLDLFARRMVPETIDPRCRAQ